MAKDYVTVVFTNPQAKALHKLLSMVENDPDWESMMGGQRQMENLNRAHTRLLVRMHHRETIRRRTGS